MIRTKETKKNRHMSVFTKWKERDSNPRNPFKFNSFQDCLDKPTLTSFPDIVYKYKGNEKKLPVNYFLKRSLTLSLIGIGFPSSSILTKVM